MGPLFALGILTSLGVVVFAVIFLLGLIFVPARRAALLALIALPAGATGAVMGGIFAAVQLGGPQMRLDATEDVLFLLGCIGIGAILTAVTACWMFMLYRPLPTNP